MELFFDVFRHETFGKLRAAIIDGEILFVIDDVCAALDYPKLSSALYLLDEDEFKTVSLNTCVNESGLYTLILRSLNPCEKTYKRWIRDEVIPVLRAKTVVNEKPSTLAAEIRDNTLAILELVKKIKDDTSTLKNVKVSFEDELPF